MQRDVTFWRKKKAQLPLRDGSEHTTSLREPKSNGFYGSAPKHPQLHEVRQNTLSSQKNSQKYPNFRFLFADQCYSPTTFFTTNDRRIMKLSLMSSEKTSSCVGWYYIWAGSIRLSSKIKQNLHSEIFFLKNPKNFWFLIAIFWTPNNCKIFKLSRP